MENKTTTFIYVLIAIIIVYYITTQYIWCDEQENFDPSLVPVSSIVTLAKVAQKLVDGNGTLTNPGNLTVAGDLIVNNNLLTTKIKANTALYYNGINNNFNSNRIILNLQNTIFISSSSGGNPNIIGDSNAVTNGFIWQVSDGTTNAPIYKNIMTLSYNGDLNVKGNINVTGEISGKCTNAQGGFSLGYGTWITANAPATDDPNKLLFENTGYTAFRSKFGFQFRNEKDQHNIDIDSQTSAVRINGPVTANKFVSTNDIVFSGNMYCGGANYDGNGGWHAGNSQWLANGDISVSKLAATDATIYGNSNVNGNLTVGGSITSPNTIIYNQTNWINGSSNGIRFPGPGVYNATAFNINNPDSGRMLQVTFYYNHDTYKNSITGNNYSVPFRHNLWSNGTVAWSLNIDTDATKDLLYFNNTNSDLFTLVVSRLSYS